MARGLRRFSRKQYEGEWWIPGAEGRRVRGALSFSGRSPRLQLDELFSNENVEIIHGRANSFDLTLHQCHLWDQKKAEFLIEYAYVGEHWRSEDQLQFREVRTELSDLHDWVRWSKWYAPSLRRDSWDLEQFRIEYKKPPDLTAPTKIGQFTLSSWLWQEGDFLTEATLKETVGLSVRLSAPQPFPLLFSRIVRPLANLVSLATTNVVPIRAIHVVAPRHVTVSAQPQVLDLPVEVLCPRGPVRGERIRTVVPDAMLFTFGDIEGTLAETLNRWFSLWDEFRFPLDLFFSVRNSRNGYFEHRFLSLAQVAEAYHRRIKRYEFPRSELDRRTDAVLEASPSEYRDWLRTRLVGGNEFTFHDRLVALLTDSRCLPGAVVHDIDNMATAIVKARNDFAHARPTFSGVGEGQFGLFRLGAVLSLLIQEYLLRELGFAPEAAAQRVSRTWEYSYAKSLAGRHDH